MAREHFVIPMALDEVGLHVAMADQPSNDLIALLGEASGTASVRCWRHLPRSDALSRITIGP